MIAYLQGTILQKLTRSIIVKVDQIGYEVAVSAPLLEKFQKDEKVELYIHTHVREDELSLYGVETAEHLKFFKQILQVPGIGPRLATDLFALPIKKIKGAIINKDFAALQSVPGIGRKIAERLTIEMKNKVEIAEATELYESGSENVSEEAVNALINLGYQRKHVVDMLKKRPEKLQKTEEIIRYFLQHA